MLLESKGAPRGKPGEAPMKKPQRGGQENPA